MVNADVLVMSITPICEVVALAFKAMVVKLVAEMAELFSKIKEVSPAVLADVGTVRITTGNEIAGDTVDTE